MCVQRCKDRPPLIIWFSWFDRGSSDPRLDAVVTAVDT